MRGVFYHTLLSFGVGAGFWEDTGLAFVPENGPVLQNENPSNQSRFLSGQDTGRPADKASSGFFFFCRRVNGSAGLLTGKACLTGACLPDGTPPEAETIAGG
jgi:hypothetical protein